MKMNSDWNPGKGDYKRSTGNTNTSIAEREKAALRKKTVLFFVLFFIFLGATLLGNYLFCNTHKIIQ